LSSQGLFGGRLRKLARLAKDRRQVRRLLAIASVDGASREEAARAGGMDRQTLRDWVLAGIAHKLRSSRPPALDQTQLEQFDTLVEEGLDICVHKIVRWRCIDLKETIKDSFDVEMSKRHAGRLLKACRFRRLSARPRYPRSDKAQTV
jgi:transposase